MLTVDGGGGGAEWMEDRKVREHFKEISDKNFYRAFSELAPFDNGEGFWTAGLNRDVEMQEFVKRGRQILSKQSNASSSDSEAFRAAAGELMKILRGRGDSFARYYLGEVLEDSVASQLLMDGADQFYVPHFRPFSGSYLRDGSRRFISGVSDAVNCNSYNRVSFDGKTKLTTIRGDSEWLSFVPYPYGREVRGGACCVVRTTVYDISQITDYRVLAQRSLRIFYIRPEDKKQDRSHKFPGDRNMWGEAATDLAIALVGMEKPEPKSLWHATILNEYLAVRAECVSRFCEPVGLSIPDPFLFEPLPRLPLPPSQAPNRY